MMAMHLLSEPNAQGNTTPRRQHSPNGQNGTAATAVNKYQVQSAIAPLLGNAPLASLYDNPCTSIHLRIQPS